MNNDVSVKHTKELEMIVVELLDVLRNQVKASSEKARLNCLEYRLKKLRENKAA